jgi:uncharacterized membrane protein
MYNPGKKFRINKYFVLTFIATTAFATAISIDIGISDEFNLPFYIFLTLLIPAVFVAIAERMPVSLIKNEWKHGSAKLYLLTAVSWALTILFSLRAYRFGQVSVIVPLQAVSVIINVLVAYVFMRERSKPFKKIAAALIVIIGVYLTVI